MGNRGTYETNQRYEDDRNVAEAIETGHAWAALALHALRETDQRKLDEMDSELGRMYRRSGYLRGVFETFQTSFKGINVFDPALGDVLSFLASRQSRNDFRDSVLVQQRSVPIQLESCEVSNGVREEFVCA